MKLVKYTRYGEVHAADGESLISRLLGWKFPSQLNVASLCPRKERTPYKVWEGSVLEVTCKRCLKRIGFTTINEALGIAIDDKAA